VDYSGLVRCWDLARTGEGYTFRSRLPAVRAAAGAGPGAVIALGGGKKGEEGKIEVWQVEGKQPERQLTHPRCVTALALSPDGRLLAVGGEDGSVAVWDLAAGQKVADCVGSRGDVLALAFSPDGRHIAATGNKEPTVRVWVAHTGRVALTIPDPAADQPRVGPIRRLVGGLAYSPDGKYLASTGCSWERQGFTIEGNVRLWDAESGRQVATLVEGHSRGGTDLAFSPDSGRLACYCEDGGVRVWKLTGPPFERKIPLGPASCQPRGLAFSPDGGHLLTGNGNGTVYVLRLDR
jgi:WD40 repeat protein